MTRAPLVVVGVLFSFVLACGDEGTPVDAGIDARRPRDSGIDAGPRCTPSTTLPDPLACNGHPELCDRTYDRVSVAMTHNAMSNEEDRWAAPNQGRNLWHQLEDGVRGFMLDTYETDDGRVLLCHGVCGRAFGERPLIDALHDLREFVGCHPGEVITLIIEDHLSPERTAETFEAAGLLPYLHAQPAGAPWPTLRAMIESGRRLVVFKESGGTPIDWYMSAYDDHVWDNDYAAMTNADFDCAANRGSTENPIFVLNHFLTAPLASRMLADMVNHDPELSAHVDRCTTEAGRAPTFVALDFYDDSDLFEVVDRLNGF